MGSGLVTVVFYGFIATDRPGGRFADRRNVRTRWRGGGRGPSQVCRLLDRQRGVRDQLLGDPAASTALGSPFVYVPVRDELFLRLLVRAALDAQFPGEFAQGPARSVFGKALDVEEQDFRVTAQARMAHDIV